MAAVMILTMRSISMNYGGDDEEEEEGRRAAAECDSFTLMSCSDFASSSLRFISDGEGGDSDSESYIEIQLDPGRTTVAADDRDGGGEVESGEEREEFELRVSISSAVPFPKLRSSTLQSCKNPEAEFCAVDGSEVPSSLSSHSSKVGIDGQNLREEERGISSDRGKGVGEGGRAAKLVAVWRMLNAVTASLKVPPEMCREQSSSSLRGNNRCHHQQMSRAGGMETWSCPSSIKCSPINRETFSNSTGIHRGECLMQAAIAHCKKSLTASCDFRFEPRH